MTTGHASGNFYVAAIENGGIHFFPAAVLGLCISLGAKLPHPAHTRHWEKSNPVGALLGQHEGNR